MYKYQTIKLNRQAFNLLAPPFIFGPSIYNVPVDTFPLKDYNNIHSYRFFVPNNVQQSSTRVNKILINEFKISDYEIFGENTPLSLFGVGNSIELNDRFIEVNIPNNLQQIKCTMSVPAPFAAINEVYLILRLNNVKPEEHFKNFDRYETTVIDLVNSPAERIKKFSFRPKVGGPRLKGISVNFINHNFIDYNTSTTPATSVPYTGITMLTPGPVGKLSLQLNDLKSNPILINCKDYLFHGVQRKVKFLDLEEPILTSANFEGYFVNSPQISPSIANFTMYLTQKYSIK